MFDTDLRWLREASTNIENDTMLLAYAIGGSKSKSLKELASEHLSDFDLDFDKVLGTSQVVGGR